MPGDHRSLVEGLRLENLLTRQRRLVLRLAQQLEDAELVRQVLESELHRVRHPLVVAGTPDYLGPNNGQSSPPLAGANGAALAQVVEHRPSGSECAGSTPAGGPAPRGNDSGGSADGTDPGGAHAQAPVTPAEPAGSSKRRAVTSHAYAPPGGDFGRGGSAWGKQAIDETGKRYGSLSVIERAPTVAKLARWRCGCDCGASTIVEGSLLRLGKVTACPACRPRGITCSRCGEAGHNVRGCAALRPEGESEPTPPSKRCIGCKVEKPLSEFYAHPSGKGQSRCKACDNASRSARAGHEVGARPGPKPKKFTCFVCAGLPHRVEGVRCRGCGLEHVAEKFSAADFSGGDSALARAIG